MLGQLLLPGSVVAPATAASDPSSSGPSSSGPMPAEGAASCSSSGAAAAWHESVAASLVRTAFQEQLAGAMSAAARVQGVLEQQLQVRAGRGQHPTCVSFPWHCV